MSDSQLAPKLRWVVPLLPLLHAGRRCREDISTLSCITILMGTIGRVLLNDSDYHWIRGLAAVCHPWSLCDIAVKRWYLQLVHGEPDEWKHARGTWSSGEGRDSGVSGAKQQRPTPAQSPTVQLNPLAIAIIYKPYHKPTIKHEALQTSIDPIANLQPRKAQTRNHQITNVPFQNPPP